MVYSVKNCLYVFLKGIRWINLFLILFFYVLFYLKFISPEFVDTYFWLILTTLLITAGGNLENDKKDRITDRLNVKLNFFNDCRHLNLSALPYFLYVFGFISALVFSWKAENILFVFYFAAVIILLINYNHALKKMSLIGNLTVSFLTGLVIWQVLIFFPIHENILRLFLWMGVILFFLNFNREILKDILDRKGDRLNGYRTLGVVSIKNALQVVFFQSVLIMLLFGYLILNVKNWNIKILLFFNTIIFAYISYSFLIRNLYLKKLSKAYKWLMLLVIVETIFL